MITTCTGCQTRYRLDADKVPERKIRVRCPECANVFDLDGTVREAPAAASVDPLVAPPPAPTSPTTTGSQELTLEPAMPPTTPPEPPSTPEPEAASDPAPPGDDLVLEPASPGGAASAPKPAGGVAVADPPKAGRRRRRDKTEMLARALVSDILVYNREARDKALADGNLLEALGPEIKKSWELYKEKVGTETATSTNHFKEALNEILAEGQDIF
jgi:predicted Zn finger-like uncharacterized protein